MLETVRRLLGGVKRSVPPADAPEIHADGDDKAALPTSHFAFEAFPRFGGLSFLGRPSVGGSSADAQSTGVRSTFVDDTQTSTIEEKVNDKNPIEADASSASEPTSRVFRETSSDEDEVQRMIDPRHERWSELDAMIDKILLEEDDHTGVERIEESEIDNASPPTIFPAYEMALHFHYLKWLNDNGVFDFPHKALTAEAVDRLFTIGWLDLVEHFDSVLPCALLGHGAYRRIHRLSGLPTHGGRILQSQGNWTVSPDAHPPTGEEIEAFIREQEDARASNEDGDGCRANGYCLPFSQRPARDLGWEKQRLVQHGYWGLRCMDRDDDMAGAMIDRHDLLFKSPERLAEQAAHEARQEACLTVNPINAHADTAVNRGTKRRRDPSPASTDAPEDTKEKVELPNHSPKIARDISEQIVLQETCSLMGTISAQQDTVSVQADNPASNIRKRRRDSFEDTSEDVGQMVAQPVLDEYRLESCLPVDTVNALASSPPNNGKKRQRLNFPGLPEDTPEDVGQMIRQPAAGEDRPVSCLPVETVRALASTSASIDRRRQRDQLGEVPSRRSARIESLKKKDAAKKAAEEAKSLIKAGTTGKPKTRRRGREPRASTSAMQGPSFDAGNQ